MVRPDWDMAMCAYYPRNKIAALKNIVIGQEVGYLREKDYGGC